MRVCRHGPRVTTWWARASSSRLDACVCVCVYVRVCARVCVCVCVCVISGLRVYRNGPRHGGRVHRVVDQALADVRGVHAARLLRGARCCGCQREKARERGKRAAKIERVAAVRVRHRQRRQQPRGKKRERDRAGEREKELSHTHVCVRERERYLEGAEVDDELVRHAARGRGEEDLVPRLRFRFDQVVWKDADKARRFPRKVQI